MKAAINKSSGSDGTTASNAAQPMLIAAPSTARHVCQTAARSPSRTMDPPSARRPSPPERHLPERRSFDPLVLPDRGTVQVIEGSALDSSFAESTIPPDCSDASWSDLSGRWPQHYGGHKRCVKPTA